MLASQMYPGDGEFLINIFLEVMKKNPYGYLILDFR